MTVLVLTAVGVVTVFSASTWLALHNTVDGKTVPLPPNYYAVRQAIAAAVGGLALFLCMRMSHWALYRWAPRLLVAALALLVIVLGIGSSAYGGRRWLGSGAFHIQPSEISIVVLAIYLAFLFTKKVTLLHDSRRTLRPAAIVTGLAFLLILAEPDMGTAMTLLLTALAVMFASGVRLRPLLLAGAALIPVVLAAALLEPYRVRRVLAFLHPFDSATDKSYQLLQGWTAIAQGGLFGRGYGMSLEKLGYLPVPQADFIFPVFVEEWGLVGAIALLLLYAVLIWRGFSVARHAADRFGALLSVGITSMITVKTLINLCAVTGLMPVTGIPLPFVSYGGSSLVVNLAAAGILLSVSRTTLEIEPESDELADVIEVKPGGLPPRVSAPPTRPRGEGAVIPLHKVRDKTYSGGGNWRTRRETAASKAGRERAPLSLGGWRKTARAGPDKPWKGDGKGRRGKPTRKDR
ncbi:MAG: cell division protein FtsW [Thermoflavifilum sp.]|nr:cell division protein FtsW [Thermoflavifilum sp.]MCL6514425.1 putative lipid II flippase FtsW [Alicyclobacillus sp.]